MLRQQIEEVQGTNPQLAKIMGQIQQGVDTPFSMQDGTMILNGRLCVPDMNNLRR